MDQKDADPKAYSWGSEDERKYEREREREREIEREIFKNFIHKITSQLVYH